MFRSLKKTMQAIKENNILKMYVDENVLNFMTHKEFETSLLSNETIDATVLLLIYAALRPYPNMYPPTPL
jgi:hypothetical protein